MWSVLAFEKQVVVGACLYGNPYNVRAEAEAPELAKRLGGDRLVTEDEADEEHLLANLNTTLNGLLRQ
jgi:hypothetical protein